MIENIFCRIKGIKLTGENIIRAMVILLIIISFMIWMTMPRFGRKIDSLLSSEYRFISKSVESVDGNKVTKFKYGRNEVDFEIICPKGDLHSYKILLKNGKKFEISYGDITEIINGESVAVHAGEYFKSDSIDLLMLLQAIESSDGIKLGSLFILILTNAIGAFLALKPRAAIAFRNLGLFKSYEPSDFNVYGTVAAGFFIILFGMFSIMRL